jgi:hypothetical protein
MMKIIHSNFFNFAINKVFFIIEGKTKKGEEKDLMGSNSSPGITPLRLALFLFTSR